MRLIPFLRQRQASQEKGTDYDFPPLSIHYAYLLYYYFFIHLDVKSEAYSYLIKRKEMDWARL